MLIVAYVALCCVYQLCSLIGVFHSFCLLIMFAIVVYVCACFVIGATIMLLMFWLLVDFLFIALLLRIVR